MQWPHRGVGIMHSISNLNTPSEKNGPKQLDQLPSWTRLSHCVTAHACCKSTPQIAYLQRSNLVERTFLSLERVADPFAGCDKVDRPSHTSPAGGRWPATASAMFAETVCSGDRDGVEFDQCAHGTLEPQLKFSDQTLPSFISRQRNGNSCPLAALLDWDLAHNSV